MMKRFAFALALLAFLSAAFVPAAHARRGQAEPPECQVEDGGVLVCH